MGEREKIRGRENKIKRLGVFYFSYEWQRDYVSWCLA
jgi:hypothetical protein